MLFESLPDAFQVLLEGLFHSSWSLLGASWSQLGASWTQLGANLEPLGCHLETSWGPLVERLCTFFGLLGGQKRTLKQIPSKGEGVYYFAGVAFTTKKWHEGLAN